MPEFTRAALVAVAVALMLDKRQHAAAPVRLPPPSDSRISTRQPAAKAATEHECEGRGIPGARCGAVGASTEQRANLAAVERTAGREPRPFHVLDRGDAVVILARHQSE